MDLGAMTSQVRDIATRFAADNDVALVYAVESVVADELGNRPIPRDKVDAFVHDVCSLHNINAPEVRVSPTSSRIVGTASVDEHLLCLSRAKSTVFTVLHEIAHFVAPGDGHNTQFRNAFIRLVRENVSVEHASLLFTLYRSVNLDTAPWEVLRR